MNNTNEDYYTFMEHGLFYADLTLLFGNTEFATKAVIKTGSPITIVTKEVFEWLNYSKEITESKYVKLADDLCTVEAYKISIDKIKIGSIDIGARDIYYVPNKNFQYNLLGMDVLSELNLEHKAVSCCLRISKPS